MVPLKPTWPLKQGPWSRYAIFLQDREPANDAIRDLAVHGINVIALAGRFLIVSIIFSSSYSIAIASFTFERDWLVVTLCLNLLGFSVVPHPDNHTEIVGCAFLGSRMRSWNQGFLESTITEAPLRPFVYR